MPRTAVFLRLFLLAIVSIATLERGALLPQVQADAAAEQDESCENESAKRMIAPEELATKTDPERKGDQTIWLSIMGEVYDVTAGFEHYGGTTGYGIFAGRDASVPFVTGNFNEEESRKTTDHIPAAQLEALAEWRKFYETEDKYPFVGLLIDPRWYDEHGEPTEHHRTLKQRLDTWRSTKGKK